MASAYVPGAVAGILGGSTTTEKVTANKKLKSKQKALQALFSKPNQIAVSQQAAEAEAPSKKKKKKAAKENTFEPAKAGKQSPKKRKSDDNAKSDSQPDPPAKKVKVAKSEVSKPAQPESATKKKERPKDRQEQRENKKKKNPEKDSRTIFVGNLPNSIEKRKVTNFFKTFGVVESVRFRSAAPADLKLPKKAVMHTKAFHEGLKTMNGYVVFKKKQSANDALAGNGEVLGGNHIRVDIVKNAKKMDTKTSVFIGNLPFDTDDEQLRTHFEDCGKIEAIRVIRDGRTGLGKGFGYIKFEDKDGMEMALRLHGRLFQKRTIRVQLAEEQTKKKKEKVPKAGDQSSKTAASPKTAASDENKKRKSFSRSMPSNVTSKDFQGVKAKSLEKMQKQQRKKKIRKKKREAAKGLLKMKGPKDSAEKGSEGSEAKTSKVTVEKGSKGSEAKGSKGSEAKGPKGSAAKGSKASTMRGTKGSSARARIAKRIKTGAPRKT